MPGFLQSVLCHEFENVLEATATVHGWPFLLLHQQSMAGQTPCKTERNSAFRVGYQKEPGPFLSFLDIPDHLLVVAQVEKSGCIDYLGFIMQARSSDKASNSAFRAR